MSRITALLLGAGLAAYLVRKKKRGKSAPKLSDGTPRAQIIFFYAPWCPSCNKAMPELKNIALRHPKIVFTYIDIEKDPKTASAFQISAIPAFIALIDGHEVDRREGFKDSKDLESFVTISLQSIEDNPQKAIEG